MKYRSAEMFDGSHTVDEDIFLCCEEGDFLSSCCKYLQTELQHQPGGGIEKEILMLGVFELML